MARESRITHSRLGRLAKLGGLATSVAGNVLLQGSKSLISGNRPVLSDLVLSPGNARKVSKKLSEMRGAAMKVGQLLSMDVGYLLPAEVSEIFANLRNDAHQMPMLEVNQQMTGALGDNWQQHFKRFHFQPVASASIGQVHLAEMQNGQMVAVKLQYPGVKESIDSDIDNIAMLLDFLKLIPADLDIQPLIEDARLQLHAEADYRQEAEFITEFARFLSNDDRFELARVEQQLSSESVLTTDFLGGDVIDTCKFESYQTRQHVSEALLELALKEVFHFGLVQTDSNFANYLFDKNSHKIQLLDFGASRHYDADTQKHLSGLLIASMENDEEAILTSAQEIGYTSTDDEQSYQDMIVDLIQTVTLPLRHQGRFDFSSSQLSQLMMDKLVKLRFEQRYTRLPPADILFLHRKLGGLYLLLAHLGAKIDVAEIVNDRIQST